MGKRSGLPHELRVAIYERILAKKIMTEAQAQAAAGLAVEAILARAPGDSLYVPRVDFEIRDREIWEKFSGANHAELAREYEMTERNIYLIIERMTALHSRRTQPALPNCD
jgi:Mor family transcriptional regulator